MNAQTSNTDDGVKESVYGYEINDETATFF